VVAAQAGDGQQHCEERDQNSGAALELVLLAILSHRLGGFVGFHMRSLLNGVATAWANLSPRRHLPIGIELRGKRKCPLGPCDNATWGLRRRARLVCRGGPGPQLFSPIA